MHYGHPSILSRVFSTDSDISKGLPQIISSGFLGTFPKYLAHHFFIQI